MKKRHFLALCLFNQDNKLHSYIKGRSDIWLKSKSGDFKKDIRMLVELAEFFDVNISETIDGEENKDEESSRTDKRYGKYG